MRPSVGPSAGAETLAQRVTRPQQRGLYFSGFYQSIVFDSLHRLGNRDKPIGTVASVLSRIEQEDRQLSSGIAHRERFGARHRLIALALVFGLLAAAAMPFDVVVARFFFDSGLPGELRRLLNWSEAFAHGLGVVLIALAVMWLDPPRRKHWPRILITAFSAGLTASVLKLTVARLRPSSYFPAVEVWETPPFSTFSSWFPAVKLGSWHYAFDSSIQSFPSGHTATAAGFACGLTAVYPRGRWLFVALALLAAMQRVSVRAHYPSDVLVGAAIGCVAGAVFAGRCLGESQ